ncbi:protein translocase subunit secF [Nitrosococcus oceani ATCC 19707]|uniref:Protein-export membrane protein SecF n=2 Tax=Nitrosococcus oceani TaxID=1229 RepID=Q3J8N9_NITOC|nr:protein translocase subunit SecF [Nitrosococcus oceani]ABA58807.1 protein translocase subunit secF [Nitrosococcus oceani ATCC 19707]EDZ68420.1 protein-export membrane protein SecF [Nitrosococcus oceani AFC27]KFI18615.1 preprotein translocase subunit SecF [Nitrosococcus oceani C-27]GEM19103.1 protein translocase subunit SecF [Nitrosococcus oceani]
MKLLKKNLRIDFMGKRRLAFAFSLALLLISISSLIFQGLSFGIDFTGGTLLEVGYEQPVELSDVRQNLEEAGFGGAIVQHFGTTRDVLIRLAPEAERSSAEVSEEILATLQKSRDNPATMRRVEFVGPKVGKDLTEQGGLAVLYALIGILIYVALRFEYRLAIGSVVALIHDVIIVLGLFSLLHFEFDLTVLAAILAVIGYSLNDTIVVSDRIRENFRKIRKGTAKQIINTSINQTLSRTIMTSLTTLLVLFALFLFGGETIHSFSTALIAGIVVGTYSSIYVATPMALALGISKADLASTPKEGKKLDERP